MAAPPQQPSLWQRFLEQLTALKLTINDLRSREEVISIAREANFSVAESLILAREWESSSTRKVVPPPTTPAPLPPTIGDPEIKVAKSLIERVNNS